MAADMEDISIIDKLKDSENFDIWKFQINIIFKANNLIEIINEEYNYFCTAWESTGKDEKTIENLISRLTTEEIRRNRQSQPEDRVAMNATKQKMASFGTIENFDPFKPEKWTTYVERMIFFFLANGIEKEHAKKSCLSYFNRP
ncbi:hypothetical protein LAZ67_12002177 [Cordylochernes scorpioides]|uniref:Uncharacterized protein n=1 Tax=Cordylochernes scorpioides TaxID=51811 RepID=A0ABY6L1L8_9ARAC|nr:hypothetical protein LAZ67_12002177 [Cordylochernes scorpioides]